MDKQIKTNSFTSQCIQTRLVVMEYTTLIVPGLDNSGSDHWQTWLETQLIQVQRVNQKRWDEPDIASWSDNVSLAIQSATQRVILVAHSFGVIASLVAASRTPDLVAGALLVAPADPSRFTISGERINQDSQELQIGLYDLMPKSHPGFPTILAASTNDYCMPFKRSAWWAKTWGSKLVSLGDAGHVNPASGYGAWPHGALLYQELISKARSVDKIWNQLLRWAY